MAREDQHFRLRIPEGLKKQIEAAATANRRSMTAEIVSRLERYDSLGGEVDALYEVARALANEIDAVAGPEFEALPLADKINEVLNHSVPESGELDRVTIARDFSSDASRRLQARVSELDKLPEHIRETVRIIGLYLANAKFATSPIKSIVVLPDDAPVDMKTSTAPVPEDFAPDEVLYLPRQKDRVVPRPRPRQPGSEKATAKLADAFEIDIGEAEELGRLRARHNRPIVENPFVAGDPRRRAFEAGWNAELRGKSPARESSTYSLDELKDTVSEPTPKRARVRGSAKR